MNRYFDFTSGQLKVVTVLSISAVLLSLFWYVRARTAEPVSLIPLEVEIAGDEEGFTGLFLLDPNTAPADSLELLPGIGRVIADRIVEYRASHRFEKEIDIANVHGIGAKTFERIRPYLRIARP
jgi:competence ComEA-like helix-hairpin-helix protein